MKIFFKNDYGILIGQLRSNISKNYYKSKFENYSSIYDSIWRKEFLKESKIRYDEKLKIGNNICF